MPLPFGEFQGKGVLNFSSCASDPLLQHLPNQNKPNWENLDNKGGSRGSCSVGSEPTSVLDARSPSPPISSSTLSSSLGGGNSVGGGGGGGGGGASTDTTGVAITAFSGGNPSVETDGERCALGLEDWESVWSGSPSQEHSIQLNMGDIEDPYVGLNKLLQSGTGSQDIGFNAGFGVVDQGFGFESPMSSANLFTNIDPFVPSDFPPIDNGRIGSVSEPIMNPALLTASAANFLPRMFQGSEGMDEKPQILNPPLMMNQNKVQFTQNPAMFLPFSYAQVQEHNLLSPPPPKRLNSGPIVPNFHQAPKVPFSDSGQELFLRRQQQQLQLLHQRPAAMAVAAAATKQKLVSDELANQQLQHAIIDQLFKTAELIEAGNHIIAQGILARLNQQLSPIGKPFQRAAFYFKEALQLLLHVNATNNSSLTSYSLIFKIGAYKSFSEISPIIQFGNFTCNQALLEAFEGYDRIHIIDFDIGCGGQWASLMQELVLRNGGAPSLKLTAFTSTSMHDELEPRFTQENLKQFASDINMALELEILTLESLNSASWPLPLRSSESEAVAVNLPIGSFSNQPSCLPLVLSFVKQLSPRIVVSLDRGCDRTDVPFPHHMIHALQSYSSLLESLDAVNVNLDALQKIERFLLYPDIERIVLGRHRSPDRTHPWRNLFLQSGFTPLTFSNFTESQAKCLVQRTPVRGFHVEKRQSSLVLCWQRKELISASAWRG